MFGKEALIYLKLVDAVESLTMYNVCYMYMFVQPQLISCDGNVQLRLLLN